MATSGYINIPEFGSASWRDPVPTATDLPATGNTAGDAVVAQDTAVIYIWNGTTWVAEGGPAGVDSLNTLTGSLTLVAGSNITITPSGSDITIASASGPALTIGTPANGLNITGSTLTIGLSSSSNTGALSNTDWSTFNSKQPAGSYITALTGDATASGPGSAVLTLATVATPGTYTSVSVNAKGLVTAGTSPSIVASVTASAPITSSGGTAPNIAITGSSLTEATSSVLTITGGSASQLTATTIQVAQAGASTSGYLPTTDWNTFNNKQSTLTFSDSLVNSGGTVTLVNDSASPGFSQYYGTNAGGTLGYFSFPSTVGANTALSNLASVAVNLSLIPGADNSIDLGSTADQWRTGYFGTSIILPSATGKASGGALSLSGGTAASSAAGGNISLLGAAGSGVTTGGAGGTVTITGGAANGDNTQNNSGGSINVTAGNSKGSSTGGTVTVSSGNGGVGTGSAGATGGTTNVNGGTGGAGSATSGNGGGFTGKGGSGGGGVAGGAGGTAQLTGGTGGTGSGSGGNGGAANVTGGSPGNNASANGGSVTISSAGGSGTGAGGAGGTVTISSGTGGGDNTQNNSGGSITVSAGHSAGSAGGPAVTITAGVGGVGTSTTGANGGNTNVNAGAGGVGSATGGTGGNVVISAGAGGNSGTPGAGGIIQLEVAATTSVAERFRVTSTACFTSNCQLEVHNTGFGLGIAHGTNCKLGTSALSGGTVTVSNTAVTANSLIFLTSQADGGSPGFVRVTAKTANTSFVITSSNGSDTSTVAWLIVEAI